ncbi:hypothetical protein NQ318_004492 [Aromia moschata]|uniref:Protoheme IX farnesyltransferase, mitochondrial n=1 Tax=Aromia moschata TaxID=1265417 RepID=A0AAV8XB49_9CUCU|nr:hypothetical protein NQ318_004492 [Aromia moschata]
MSTILLLSLCRQSKLVTPPLSKKYVKIFVPATTYVNQTKAKSSPPTVDLSQDEIKSLPFKPKHVPAWRPTPSTDYSNIVQHYLKLSKIRLTALVVVTSMAGYAVAPAPFDWSTFTLCIIGTGLLSGAANTINQFHEVPFDAQMSRTKHRILVCGRLTPLHSAAFAAITGSCGLAVLYFGVNGITASLGLANLILYTSVYTPLKRISIINTWIGSIVGAIPPLMGWAACANTIGPGGWLMAALLYCWQFPHFNALSWNLRPDYSRAGYRMMAVTNPGLCRRGCSSTHCCHSAAVYGSSGVRYHQLVVFIRKYTDQRVFYISRMKPTSYRFYKDSSSSTSRKLFRYSLIHLPALMVLFLLNKKKWFVFEDNENKDDIVIDK